MTMGMMMGVILVMVVVVMFSSAQRHIFIQKNAEIGNSEELNNIHC